MNFITAQRRKDREKSLEIEPKKSKLLSYNDIEDGQNVEDSPRITDRKEQKEKSR